MHRTFDPINNFTPVLRSDAQLLWRVGAVLVLVTANILPCRETPSTLGPISHSSGPRSKMRPSPWGPLVIGAGRGVPWLNCILFLSDNLVSNSFCSLCSTRLSVGTGNTVGVLSICSHLTSWDRVPLGWEMIWAPICASLYPDISHRRRKTIDDKNETIGATGDGGSLSYVCSSHF